MSIFELQSFFHNFITGTLVLFLVSLCMIITSPILVYRWLVTRIFARYFSSVHSYPVSIAGHGCATDFLPANIKSSCRSALLVNIIFKGHITQRDLYEKVRSGWICRKDKGGNLMYPEFQCYLNNFLGYMFWQTDNKFQLANHILHHDIGENSTNCSSEIFMCSLMESLVNIPFAIKRSPWEIHLIHNYRHSALCTEPMTVLLIKVHHSMVDGASLMTAIGIGLLDQQMEKLDMVYKTGGFKSKSFLHVVRAVVPKLPRIISDTGHLVCVYLQRNKTPLLVSDANKTWRQICSRTELIPVEQIKQIRRKYGVSFTAVLLSAISAGLSRSMKRMHKFSDTKFGNTTYLPVGIPVPLWSNAKRLGVHSTATLLELPISDDVMQPEERLLICQRLLNGVKGSTLPTILTCYAKVFFSGVAPIARHFAFNTVFPVYLTNFPTPSNDFHFLGKHQIIAYDYMAGGLLGNAGLGFIIPSYKDNLRIIATAESALFNTFELNQLICRVQSEIQRLL